MIPEKLAQESVDFLFASAIEAAQARANRSILEQGLKRVKAMEMQKVSGAVSAQERDAYASDAYRVALEGLKEAIFEDEKIRALRDAHAARLDAWRTEQATMRSVRL